MWLSENEWQRVSPYLELYDIDVQDVESMGQGRYLLRGPTRSYEACIIPTSSALLRREVGDFTAQHRFRTIQRFLRNRDNERQVFVDSDHVFYVTDSFSGTPLDVSPADVQDAVDNLICLHSAMKGFTVAKAGDDIEVSGSYQLNVPRVRYGQWLSALNHAATQFATARLWLKSKELPSTPEVTIWSDWLNRWEDQALQAVHMLERCGYADMASDAEKSGEIAWNDYTLHHLRRLGDGRIATLQVRDPVFDNRLYDLASLCQTVCTEGHSQGVRDAVSRYGETHALTAEQIAAVKAFAAFPHHAQLFIHQVRKNGLDNLDPNWRRRAELQHDAATSLLS